MSPEYGNILRMAGTLTEGIAEEIRAMLGRQQRSQAWLSRNAKVSPTSLSRKLSGARPFTTDELERIARTLGVPVSKLLVEAA